MYDTDRKNQVERRRLKLQKRLFEGDELDRMRARQQRKKQGRPAAPTGDSYDLSPDQIEELDLDDYDTYESALKQELNRTIAQTKQEQKNPNRKENRNAMRQDRAAYERPRKKRKKETYLRKNPASGGMPLCGNLSVPPFPC